MQHANVNIFYKIEFSQSYKEIWKPTIQNWHEKSLMFRDPGAGSSTRK